MRITWLVKSFFLLFFPNFFNRKLHTYISFIKKKCITYKSNVTILFKYVSLVHLRLKKLIKIGEIYANVILFFFFFPFFLSDNNPTINMQP